MRDLFSRAIKLSGTYALGNIILRIVRIAIIPISTFYLDPKDYGILALMAITVAAINKLVSTPVKTALNRYYYYPKYQDIQGVLTFNLGVALLISGVVISISYWFSVDLLNRLLGVGDQYIMVVKAFLFILILEPWRDFLSALLQIRERAGYVVGVQVVRKMSDMLVTVVCLITFKMGVMAVVLGQIVSLVLCVILYLPPYIKELTAKFSFQTIKEPLQFGWTRIFVGYSRLLIQGGDRYLMKFFRSVNDVGLYNFGCKLAETLGTVVLSPIRQGFWPTIMKLESEPEQQREFIRRTTTYACLGGGFAALVIGVFSQDIIMILASRPSFWGAWVVVPIVAMSYLLETIAIFGNAGMILAKKGALSSAVLVTSAIVNLGANIILIPLMGIIGAAVSTVISFVVWISLSFYFSAKLYQIHFDLRRLAQVLSITCLVGWVSIFLPSYLIAYEPAPVSESAVMEVDAADTSLSSTGTEPADIDDATAGIEQNAQGEAGEANGQEFVRGRGERRVNRLMNPALWTRIGIKSILIFLFPLLLIVTGFFNDREWAYIRAFFGKIKQQGLLGFVKGLVNRFRGGRKAAKESRKAKQERNRKQRAARFSTETHDEPGGIAEGPMNEEGARSGGKRGAMTPAVREAMRVWIKEQRDAGVEISPEAMNTQREQLLRELEEEGGE